MPEENRPIPEEIFELLLTKEYDDLDESTKDFFREKASIAFTDFPKGAKKNKNNSVTLSPDVQAKIVFNAMSHKQQASFFAALIARLILTIGQDHENLSEESVKVLEFATQSIPQELLLFHAIAQQVVNRDVDFDEVN